MSYGLGRHSPSQPRAGKVSTPRDAVYACRLTWRISLHRGFGLRELRQGKPENLRGNYGWLVISTLLKNFSQLGWVFPICRKIKNVPNHQPDGDFPVVTMNFMERLFRSSCMDFFNVFTESNKQCETNPCWLMILWDQNNPVEESL